MDVHPSSIVEGYKLARFKAEEILSDMATEVPFEDEKTVKYVAQTSMSSKIVSGEKEPLSKIVVKAIKAVAEDKNGDMHVDIDNIQIQKKKGGSLVDTELIDGIILDKEVVHADMPKKVEEAKILLIDKGLELSKTEIDAKINITSPDQIQAFLDNEHEMLKEMADKIIAAGANVVLCQKGVDDIVQHYLAKKGIAAVRRIKKSDMEKLAKATGAKITTSLEEIDQYLGKAKSVEEATQEYLKLANEGNLCSPYDIIIGDKKHANIIEMLPNKTNITTHYDSVFRTTHFLNMNEYKKHSKHIDRSKAKLRKVIELTKKVKTPEDVVSILNFHHKNGLKNVRRQHYGSDVGSISAEWKNNEVVLYHVLNK